MPQPAILLKRPVAFRVKDHADGWLLCHAEEVANHEAEEMGGALVQGLYVRDGTAIVAEWQPIETAPTGDDDFYLVCCNDPEDHRSPFVMRGSILESARQGQAPGHLSLHHLTHWMPLPDKPAANLSR